MTKLPYDRQVARNIGEFHQSGNISTDAPLHRIDASGTVPRMKYTRPVGLIVFTLALCSACAGSSSRPNEPEGEASTVLAEPWYCEPAGAEEWQCVRSAEIPERSARSQATTTTTANSVADDPMAEELETPNDHAAAPPPTLVERADEPLHVRLAYHPKVPVSLLEIPASFWAVQLIALDSAQELESFAQEHQLEGMSAATVMKDGKQYYVLLVGIYETAELAQQAVESLPAKLADLSPWVRPMGSLQNAMRSARNT